MAFTLVQSFVGGLCLGVGVAIALVVDGKIAGFSGILGPLTRSVFLGGPKSWRVAFLVGCALGGLMNLPLNSEFAFPAPPPRPWWIWAAGAAMVGVGTRLGGGCTSGHGLCGLARLSPRSLVAVCSFMGAAMTMATLSSLVAQDFNFKFSVELFAWPTASQSQLEYSLACLALCLLLAVASVALPVICPAAAGISMGLGLGCAGMTSQTKVMAFLNFAGCWDPSLAFVMGGGLCVTFPAFAWARSRADAGPLHEGMDFEQPKKSSGPDAQLVIGSAVFGLGWGTTGLCPGPDIAGILPNSVLGWERGALYLLFMASLCAAWMLTMPTCLSC